MTQSNAVSRTYSQTLIGARVPGSDANPRFDFTVPQANPEPDLNPLYRMTGSWTARNSFYPSDRRSRSIGTVTLPASRQYEVSIGAPPAVPDSVTAGVMPSTASVAVSGSQDSLDLPVRAVNGNDIPLTTTVTPTGQRVRATYPNPFGRLPNGFNTVALDSGSRTYMEEADTGRRVLVSTRTSFAPGRPIVLSGYTTNLNSDINNYSFDGIGRIRISPVSLIFRFPAGKEADRVIQIEGGNDPVFISFDVDLGGSFPSSWRRDSDYSIGLAGAYRVRKNAGTIYSLPNPTAMISGTHLQLL